ncbi:fimbrial protein FimD [Erwinia persicina]|uniref:Fimbrial biogenesis usher protein n=3 Tax=Enterobacterales TaxID=91347 RepID=A0ACC5PVV0_ENTAG|nr:fimbrial biogenesis usher protein [Erwinia persicina]MBD8129165.1 fimbrial biogenesis usher protein [Pantoea agglomerans]MBD8212491.1 fimbrial biogenesis usher protein [Erwinia persicina]MBD8234820.1 fimbrial biogenesis usher protein [Pantoea agglomerans]MBD8245232.1 fimbrial biogenesis usher protein [Pantoea agglomerans]
MINFKLSPLAALLAGLLMPSAYAGLHFDPAMISGDPQAVADLSRFESGNAQAAGEYMVDIYLNGSSVSSRNVHFIAVPASERQEYIHDSTGLMACLSKKDLTDMGVNVAPFPTLTAVKDDQCVSPGRHIPQAYTAFDFQKMRLDISIPQAALQNRPHGWIPPEQWDEGINAALLSYQFSGSENRGSYGNSRSHYLNLTSGLNLGAWRLRDNSTWNDYESRYGTQRRWQHLNTYVQRAIIPWRSELTAGDSTTGGDVFDSLSFRGIQLASDDSMYPDTMRGFAPEIKGNANSNAQVSVRQNGNVIYRTFVAPGAFVIKDLYPLSSGGDLNVTVTEADGSARTFTVPYSSLPVLQRQGHVRYGVTAGRYRSSSDSYTTPSFAQGTVLWGLPHNITAYGGTQLSDSYRALALGTGLNMGVWGAVSADITQASSTLTDGSHHEGQSVRFLYGRSLISTGTTFQLVGYRYSTQGFHTLEETALKGMSGWMYDSDEVDAAGRPVKRNWINHYNLYSNKRERIQASISQRLGDLGSLWLTGSHQTYWQDTASTDSLQAGFSSTLAHVSYSLSYGYSRVSSQPVSDQTLSLSLSIPLDNLLSHGDMTDHHHSMWATYGATRDSEGHLSHQAGLSGTALEGDNLDWSVAQGYGRQDGNSGDLSMGYQGGYGSASLGYGYSRDYRQVRYGASGSAVLHSGGLTLGQPLGSTSVLIAAPGAADVPVENSTGIHTDWRGYTVVPYASDYRENRVALDVSGLDDHTDIDNPVARVIPTRGALVRADFRAHTGVRGLMTLSRAGRPLPFGSMVSTADGRSSGLVGDGGQVWLSGLAQEGTLKAKWGESPEQQCTVQYRLPASALQAPLVQVKEPCR